MCAQESRLIFHVDMDAFFAAVEQLDHPHYRNKPVIVGGIHQRGVVAAASYEARSFGIHSALPMTKARHLCPRGIFLAPRFSRYKEISDRVMEILRTFTPLVEVVALDEAFLDVSSSDHSWESAKALSLRIQEEIMNTTGLSCSIGVASNKFLAKLASDLKKPAGLVVVDDHNMQQILDPLPVGKIIGVGKVTEQRLNKLGLTTIRDLRRASLKLLILEFGRHGRSLYRLARGRDDSPVIPSRETKTISREVTLPEDLYDLDKIEDLLQRLSKQVAADLRKAGLLARTIRIKIRFHDFRTITRQITVASGVDSFRLIQSFVVHLFRHRVALGEDGVRLVGVGVSSLVEAHFRQLSLFDDQDELQKNEEVDGLTQRFGDDKIRWQYK
ncbi:DNA polymerase IV [Candidatus Acetothermia bacterium]|nr:DNA polymerase IV [Candidatus Acetothermia bacterium]